MSRYDFNNINIIFNINEKNLGVYYINISFRIIKFEEIIFV